MSSLSRIILVLLASSAALVAQADRFGLPACAGPDREFADRSFFVLCHSAAWKVPVWVAYELVPDYLLGGACRPSHFRHDAELSHPGALDGDYRNSGFSRGHLAPAADFGWSDQAIRATFLLSNAVPQRRRMNAGIWSRIEVAVRRVAATSDATYVFTGPVFVSRTPEVIGFGRIAVPDYLFKVVLAIEGSRKTMFAAIVPNAERAEGTLDSFMTTVDEVERITELDFFACIPRVEQEEKEGTVRFFSPRPTIEVPVNYGRR